MSADLRDGLHEPTHSMRQHLPDTAVVVCLPKNKIEFRNSALHDLQRLCTGSVWEMYVFFSMAQDAAKSKLQVVPLGETTDTIDGLLSFNVNDAHCFSEEDEIMIRSIIGDDVERFELEIREAAKNLKFCLEQPGELDLEKAYLDLSAKYERLQEYCKDFRMEHDARISKNDAQLSELVGLLGPKGGAMPGGADAAE